jgi:hypothetical protein
MNFSLLYKLLKPKSIVVSSSFLTTMMPIDIVLIICAVIVAIHVIASIYAAIYATEPAAEEYAAATTAEEYAAATTAEEYAAATTAAKIVCEASRKIANDTFSLYHEFNDQLIEMPANITNMKHLRLSNRTKNLKVRAEDAKITADHDLKAYEAARRADTVTFAEDAYQRTEVSLNRMENAHKKLESFTAECATLFELNQYQINYLDWLKSRYELLYRNASEAAALSGIADRRVQH